MDKRRPSPSRKPGDRPRRPDAPRSGDAPRRSDAPHGGDAPRKLGFTGKPKFSDKPGFGGKQGFDKKPGFIRKPVGDKPSFGRKPDAARMPSVPDARKLALSAYSDVVRAHAYSTLALDRHLGKSKLSPEDRRLATSIFYAALENRLRIAYVLGALVEHMPEPIIEDILHIAAAQLLFMDRLPDHAVVNEAVNQVKNLRREGFAPLVNGALRSLIRKRDAGEIEYPDREQYPIRHLSVMHSLPEPLVKRLVDDYGLDEAEAIMSYRPKTHEQVVRPNLLTTDAQSFEKLIEARGWTAEKGVVPMAYKLGAVVDLGADEEFRRGMFTLISEPSMLAAYAVSPVRGQTILDACAAPGGKAAMLCELMGGSGRVHAWDIHEHRVELLKAMGKRLRLDNLRPALRDAAVFRPDLEASMDRVLIDAPCSGLGLMVGKPDIKYRVADADIGSLAALQVSILDTCARYVVPGGLLVYSTCTIMKDENERQVAAFLERHPEFEPDADADWLPEPMRPRWVNGMIQLLPHVDHMEGFFIARMRRKRP